jgi:hypothetical protein
MSTFRQELRGLRPYFTARVYNRILKDLLESKPGQNAYPPADPLSIVLDTITRDIEIPNKYSKFSIDTDCTQPQKNLQEFFILCTAIFSRSYVAAKKACFKHQNLVPNIMRFLNTAIASQPLSYWLKCMITEIFEKHRIPRRGSIALQSPLGGRRPVTVEHIKIRGKSLIDAWSRFRDEHPRSELLPSSRPRFIPHPDQPTGRAYTAFWSSMTMEEMDRLNPMAEKPKPKGLSHEPPELTPPGSLKTANLPIFLGTSATVSKSPSVRVCEGERPMSKEVSHGPILEYHGRQALACLSYCGVIVPSLTILLFRPMLLSLYKLATSRR